MPMTTLEACRAIHAARGEAVVGDLVAWCVQADLWHVVRRSGQEGANLAQLPLALAITGVGAATVGMIENGSQATTPGATLS